MALFPANARRFAGVWRRRDGPAGLPAMSARGCARTSALGAQEANPFWMLGVGPPTDMGSVPDAQPRVRPQPAGARRTAPWGARPACAAMRPGCARSSECPATDRRPLVPAGATWMRGPHLRSAGTAAADTVGLCAGRAGHGHPGIGREPHTAAGRRDRLRSRRRHVRALHRHSAGQAQRAARSAGVAARPAGEPARVDDDRARRDAVRFHFRDARSARRHQGAARAIADSGAQGGDARRRVLREEEPSGAHPRQRAGASRARLVRRRWGTRIRCIARSTRSSTASSTTSTTTSRSSRTLRTDLEQFLEAEEKAADANIQATAEEIHERDRREIAPVIARSQTERRIETYPVPNFLAVFLRQRWVAALEQVYLEAGDESEAWDQAVATIEDLVWSVQPKRTREDRKHLVALLPSLLKRLTTGLHDTAWPREEREQFMENLVEAHAAAVKPQAASAELPTEAVAEQAKADAEQAKAAGDDAGAVKAEELAAAMARAEPVPAPAAPQAAARRRPVPRDRAKPRARHVDRIRRRGRSARVCAARVGEPVARDVPVHQPPGTEGAVDDGRGTGRRFRNDRARLVEAEPLLDQAFTSMMANLGDRSDGGGRTQGAAAALRSRRDCAADPAAATGRARRRTASIPACTGLDASHGDRRADHRRRDPFRQARRTSISRT